MKIIKGNNLANIAKKELDRALKSYNKVVIDIGTGDGRFVYKNALKNDKHFYIGIDSSQKQLEIYSKKANKKRLKNVLFVLSTAQNPPKELTKSADLLTINLPWGSLLKDIVKPEMLTILKLSRLLKTNGKVEILFGFLKELEPKEIQRLGLENIDSNYILESIAPVFSRESLILINSEIVSINKLSNVESTWIKKLKFGRERALYKLCFQKCD